MFIPTPEVDLEVEEVGSVLVQKPAAAAFNAIDLLVAHLHSGAAHDTTAQERTGDLGRSWPGLGPPRQTSDPAFRGVQFVL